MDEFRKELEKLTPRQQAIKVIQMGDSVVIDGKQYTVANVHELPDEDVFVKNNPAAKQATKDTIQAEIERLLAIQHRLNAEDAVEAPAMKETAPIKEAKEAKEDKEAKAVKDAK